jgi:hypothetical protein
MGCSDLSDGVWAWPEGLHHYLEIHQLVLPEEFVRHARATGAGASHTLPGFETQPDGTSRIPLSQTFWLEWARSRGAA